MGQMTVKMRPTYLNFVVFLGVLMCLKTFFMIDALGFMIYNDAWLQW